VRPKIGHDQIREVHRAEPGGRLRVAVLDRTGVRLNPTLGHTNGARVQVDVDAAKPDQLAPPDRRERGQGSGVFLICPGIGDRGVAVVVEGVLGAGTPRDHGGR
jgi:hypothetical protein